LKKKYTEKLVTGEEGNIEKVETEKKNDQEIPESSTKSLDKGKGIARSTPPHSPPDKLIDALLNQTGEGDPEEGLRRQREIAEKIEKDRLAQEAYDKEREELEHVAFLTVCTPWNPDTRPLDARDFIPKETYEVPASRDVLLDLPRSPHACVYKVFKQINSSLTVKDQSPAEAKRLQEFYKKHAQSENLIWSRSRIQACTQFPQRKFANQDFTQFTITRSDGSISTITEADFPRMNPADIFSLCQHFENKKDSHSLARFPCGRLKNFLFHYVTEIGRRDRELCSYFWDYTTSPPNSNVKDLEKRKKGITDFPEVGMIFGDQDAGKKCFFRLSEKYLYTSKDLIIYRDAMRQSKKGSEALKNQFIQEINWWLAVRKWIYAAMLFLDKTPT
jgi:hypothetical protein